MTQPARSRGPRGARALWWGAVAAGVALALGLGFRWLDRRRAGEEAFPPVRGSLQVAGLGAPVRVVRDRNGVAHVSASRDADAWLALGFVHAQDRLAQMIDLRRAARGESAAQLGPAALPADRWARTLGLARLAEASVPARGSRTRAVLDAYAAGVNARIARVRAGLDGPPLALRGEPEALEPWTPADSLALVALHAWSLDGSAEESFVLGRLIERFGGLEARVFFPEGVGLRAVPAGGPRTLAVRPWTPAPISPLRAAAGLRGASVGSTAFLVPTSVTGRSGALLAADHHFEARAPAALYEAHLRGPGLDVAGASLPGIPAFWTGFTPDAAWAATHFPAVVTDLFVETLASRGAARYRDGGRWKPLEVREEVIRVAGGAPETLVVRSTRRGPLVGGLLGETERTLSVRWAGAVGGESLAGLVALARAHSADDVRAALRRHRAPVLRVAYADRRGEGGVQLAGFLPARELPSGGVPVPARNPGFAWRDPLPFEALPRRALDRTDAFLVAADGPLGSGATGVEVHWRTGDRERFVRTALQRAARAGPVDVADLVAIQRDVTAAGAPELVEASLRQAGDAGALRREAREIAAILRAWDGQAAADSVGAAAYHVFLDRLVRSLFAPRLGEPLFERVLGMRGLTAAWLARRVLRDAEAGGLEPGRWSDPQAVREAVRRSLRDTWIALSVRLGANREKWTWGRLHRLRFEPLRPGAWGGAADRLGPLPYGGDGSSVQVAEPEGPASFDARVVSVYRFVADAGDLDQALTSLAPGQSEHPGHPHATDALARWLQGRPSLLSTSPPVIEDGEVAELVLEPTP